MAPFLALITPVGGDTSPPQPPLGIWGPTDPRPTPPIAGPGRPPWWGIANDPGYSPPWARPPVDPGYSPPWAQVPPGGQGGGPVDPGYSPPWAQVPGGGKPPQGPVDPGYSPPWAQVPPGGQGGGPVDPGYSPPWAQVPGGGQPPVGPPNLPEGGGVIVPLPEGADAPDAPAGTPENHEPYVVWFGPGTVVSVVYLPPPATTKPTPPGQGGVTPQSSPTKK